MNTMYWYVGAALAELSGCFAFWAWLRLGRPVWWIVPGIVSLIVFALLLTRTDAAFAGRAYAAYGGVYIAASLLWLWAWSRCHRIVGMCWGQACVLSVRC